ncbi:hypothetical protein F4779DRAFT_614163 [Xylariaceae sp. FL0662B]|nr:hypothetical protein F4779DRAFT_614163 [Xylariaceae sp. FL0662B]
METLPAEVLLKIAEHMDIVSMRAFMGTNKQQWLIRLQQQQMQLLIKSHERSISKARAAQFMLPPTGNIFSSCSTERWAYEANTFKMVQELETRDDHINQLLRRTDYINIGSIPCIKPLTVEQQERLFPLLKRAMVHCDHIADIAANPPCKPIPTTYWAALQKRVYLRSNIPPEYRDNDPYSHFGARPWQIEYIRKLSLQDLAMLYCLTSLFAWSYAREPITQADPTAAESITVFEECILRHGSWFLWARLGKPEVEPMQYMTNLIVAAGLSELISWETGMDGAPPGLRMTMMNRFRELVGLDGHLHAKMRKIVKGLIGADEEDENETQGSEEAGENENVN